MFYESYLKEFQCVDLGFMVDSILYILKSTFLISNFEEIVKYF